MALWGGRFEGEADPLFRRLNDSFSFDYRLLEQDIAGSIAWARAIGRAGVLTREEVTRLEAALETLRREHRSNATIVMQSIGRDEDVHSYVERRLVEALGPLGKKLHTGRSRNDQVATDLRLWTVGQIDQRREELTACRKSLVNLAHREVATVLPGYTHMQRAQPVLLAHWALAYAEMLERHEQRLLDARRRTAVCPLGSGALAGSAYPIDRDALAKDLGFECATRNSLDGVSDRDFVLETLSAIAIAGVHLSRLGEDLVLYGSQEFAFFEYSDAVSSGSSLMPQKKNPDAAELLRGKAGRLTGALMSLLMTTKGLPLSYNKDLQEDKEPLLDAMDQLSLCLQVVPRILDTLKVRRDVCLRAAKVGYANATDLADYLVAKGVPFRDAHEQAGRAVRLGIASGRALEELELDTLRTVAPAAQTDVFDRLALAAGLASRNLPGGTGPKAVAHAVHEARVRLGLA